jgi:3-hydroxyisobutyrate dehydrogenase-like beta-hydroxyacid dehydrogenase
MHTYAMRGSYAAIIQDETATVIGLEAMDSALARALLRDGHRATVWNRTRAKAESLVKDGAVLALRAYPSRLV